MGEQMPTSDTNILNSNNITDSNNNNKQHIKGKPSSRTEERANIVPASSRTTPHDMRQAKIATKRSDHRKKLKADVIHTAGITTKSQKKTSSDLPLGHNQDKQLPSSKRTENEFEINDKNKKLQGIEDTYIRRVVFWIWKFSIDRSKNLLLEIHRTSHIKTAQAEILKYYMI